MEVKNIPIQVIALCGEDGELRPLRFRYQTQAGECVTVQIWQVLDVKQVEYVGLEAFVYLCLARLEDRECRFELKYTVSSHLWVLFRAQSE